MDYISHDAFLACFPCRDLTVQMAINRETTTKEMVSDQVTPREILHGVALALQGTTHTLQDRRLIKAGKYHREYITIIPEVLDTDDKIRLIISSDEGYLATLGTIRTAEGELRSYNNSVVIEGLTGIFYLNDPESISKLKECIRQMLIREYRNYFI
jgi:hypothetical protein